MSAIDFMPGTMSAPNAPLGPDHVAEKVLRRAEIAKVARNLQECLAFASFKAQNGLQNRTLRTIEPEFSEQLKRKRPHSADDLLSDSSLSSPEKDFDRDLVRTRTCSTSQAVQARETERSFKAPMPRKRVRSSTTAGQSSYPATGMSWQHTYHVPLSSSSAVHTLPSVASHQNAAFRSDTTTVLDSHPASSPIFDMHHASDGEDDDLPLHSFQALPSSSIISSSPPRTPPPMRGLGSNASKQASADLLVYLATSPSRSPAVKASDVPTLSQEPPSTPPSQQTHLPSSVMNTPGTNLGLFNGAIQTPGQSFNFADFVNVTPSPGQVHWGARTPGMAKTPRLARRGLNFDNLLPPTTTPDMSGRPSTSQGLALELGEELLPRV